MISHGFVSVVLAVWIGITFTPDKGGLRVTSLPYLSPAAKAGVRVGDIIVALDGEAIQGESAFREAILAHTPGEEISLRLIRDGEHEVDIKLPVEERPLGIGRVKEYSAPEAERAFPKVDRPEEQLANELIDEFKIRDDYQDLRRRLAVLSDRGDQFRLSRLAYIQHEPFQLRSVAGKTLDSLAASMNQRNPLAALQQAAGWLDLPVSALPPLRTGLTLDEHLAQLTELLERARTKKEEAFSKLTAEDRKYLEDNCDRLFADFSNAKDIDVRVLEIAAQVDLAKLLEGAELLWRAGQDKYLDDLESALRKAWEAAGRPEGIFITRDSPAGKILAGGSGSTWYTDDAAIVLDLAGRDFYTNNAGSPRGRQTPAALLIDFAGDDAYEATFNWAQGSARMGHGLLIDRGGNDQYVGQQWTQGAAVLGTALLLDEAGNDTYRADQYAQAVAVWGVAIHADYDGDDVYESRYLSQGVGMPGGAGWLWNGQGNDRYYSKGGHPTEYGDPGIFDSWSQGCGLGFRGMESGGVAILYDGAGADRYEAGNFSQGGGYYFGTGILRDGGRENDSYVGSRYNQGFAAHQSVGYFEEAGGDDFYTTRHAVAQGTAWDESVIAFIDHNGDDTYEGGASFSQGASAHNSFNLFLDLGGRNRFVYGLPQGSAGPNDYHGGKSFSLFVTVNGKESVKRTGDHGIVVERKSWKDSR